jgi:polyhydroxyalkanoate synthase
MDATLYWAKTRDGVRLALYNYRPAKLEPHRSPVFLCHGMGSNRCDLDYPGNEDQSLAKHLCRAGHDVWVIELRGAGRSSKPRFIFGKLRYDWVLDDYVVHDIPAAVARVLEITQRPSIHWVGHSMGGMLAYPFLVTSNPQLVRSCVTVGAPSIAVVSSQIHDAGMKAIGLIDFIPFIPHGLSGKALAPFAKYLRKIVERVVGNFFYNPKNMTDETLTCLLANAVENLPVSLVKQIAESYRTKHHQSYYGTFSIRDNLHRIETPTLIIAGAIDSLTPPDDLKYVFDRISSRNKEFVVVGRASGASEDYGHVDLILGKNAAQDVFPMIESWIDRHERIEPRIVDDAGRRDEASAA